MSARADTVAGDGRVHVQLAELLALRARAAKLALPTLRSEAPRSGGQRSRTLARGMDYAESRVYQPGDDVRRLDWRLTARSGRLHTKLFQEERESRLLIVLDTNASMRFGTRGRFKSVQAARAAAWATWLAIRAGERVGLMAFGQGEQLVRPQGGTRGALAVCGALASWDASAPRETEELLSDALLRVRRLLHGDHRLLLISDGFSCDDAARGLLSGMARHAGAGVLLVADALELALPPPGRYPLAHAGLRREVALFGDRQRQSFQQAMGAGRVRLESLAHSLALPHRTIDTTADPQDAVVDLLTHGGRR